MKIFITGSEGQLGNGLHKILSSGNELCLGTKDR